ncbi:MAG: TonB-dependent receptor, partial [Proteobacteria bacterium]|nr:TonB-dependent receptor [Pseudomonadota bacterium]
GLTIQGSASYNKTELTNSPCLIGNIPGTAIEGQCVQNAWVGTAASGNAVSVTDVFGAQGQELANSPKLQANARVRYEWNANEFHYYWQLGAAYQGSSLSSATVVNQYEMPAWTTYDGSIGVERGNWHVDLVGSNLTDINKSLFTSAAQFIVAEVPQRPRTLGLRFGYRFSGE